MKSLFPVFILLFFLSAETLHAQQQYTIGDQTYFLNTEVEGSLTLLWNTIDGKYRYFSKKDESVEELKNTKQNGEYLEEYKATLKRQTNDAAVSTEKVVLTLPSLQAFFASYNKLKDPNFNETEKSIDLQFRLGAFAGITNSVYTKNPTNAMQPIAGIELEVVDHVKLKRHSMVLRFKQTFESSDYKYAASQVSLNYHFKFVKTSNFDIYVNTKFAAFTRSSSEVEIPGESGSPSTFESVSEGNFNSPFTFGIGADYKLGNGYITFNYADIVGLNVENNDEFPLDLTLGYKFNL